MAPTISERLAAAIDALLQSITPRVEYYGMGGNVEIPTAAEQTLLKVLEQTPPRTRHDVHPIANRLTMKQIDLLGAFAIRMATLAVRRNLSHVLVAGAFGIVIDEDVDDWRDILLVMAVIEDSASRLGEELQTAITPALRVASEPRRKVINGYFAREAKMRGIGAMNIEALGEGDMFRYKMANPSTRGSAPPRTTPSLSLTSSEVMGKMLESAIRGFLVTVPGDVRHGRTAADMEIPTAAERMLLQTFAMAPPRTRDDLRATAGRLKLREANLLAGFAIRSAAFAVQCKDSTVLCAAAFGLVVDDNLLDLSDVVGGLSIFEDCAFRLGTDLQSVLSSALRAASDVRRQTMVEYLSRSGKGS
jgi:hypothetical protein